MIIYSDEIIKNVSSSVNLLEYASQYIEFNIESGRFYGKCPFHHENTPSFMVDVKKNRYYCFGCKAHGDVIDFVRKIERLSFFEAVEKLASYSGIRIEKCYSSETYKILKELQPKEQVEVTHNILPNSVLESFSKSDISEWQNEGISQEIMDDYGIRYDVKGRRIIYPVYDNNGNLINIKGRTLCDNWKSLRIPKYINYYKVGTMDYVQGLYRKKEIARVKNEIIVFEGVKSCMKAEGWGYDNVVSAETSAINLYQTEELLKLHCDIVIAFDKDKNPNEVAKTLDWLTRFTNVFIINDKNNLLGDASLKNSPVDMGRRAWEQLYKSKERVML